MNSRGMIAAICTTSLLVTACANASGSQSIRSTVSTTLSTATASVAPTSTVVADPASENGSITATTLSVSGSGDVVDQPNSSDAPFAPLDLAVGTCFDDPPDDVALVTPDDIPIVECGALHANEVFGNVDIDQGEFPGAAAVQTQAESLCSAAFEGYVGAAYEDSVLDFSWYFPTAESWPIGGTNIICFAYNADLSNITGSVAGRGR